MVRELVISVLLGLFAGTSIGFGASRMPGPSVVGSITGVVVAVFATTLLAFFVFLRISPYADLAPTGFFAFGSDELMGLAKLVAVAAVGHLFLGWFRAIPWLVEHRPIVLSVFTGIYTSVSVVRVLRMVLLASLG